MRTSSWDPITTPPALPEIARVAATAALDCGEAAARAVSECAWLLGRASPGPAGWVARAYGDLARDLTAVQLSAARWWLDL
jgi:hypothetical protein